MHRRYQMNAGQEFVRRGGLFDLQRIELAVTLQNNVNLFGVTIATEVKIRLRSCVPVDFHDFRHGEVFQQCAAHGATFSDLRR